MRARRSLPFIIIIIISLLASLGLLFTRDNLGLKTRGLIPGHVCPTKANYSTMSVLEAATLFELGHLIASFFFFFFF